MLFIWNGPSQGVGVGNRRKHKPVDEYEFMRPLQRCTTIVH